MIRNLNQVTFQRFGTVLPERNQQLGDNSAEVSLTLNLNQTQSPVYCASAETWIRCSSGTSILSVSDDGASFSHFYLDKAVRVRAQVQFSVSAFKGDTSVLIQSDIRPKVLGTRDASNLRIDPQMKVEGIYTFFYQEKEQGFVFSGESHPMPELTYVDQGTLHSVVDGQDLLLKQGDLVIYGPNQWHMQYADMGVAPRFVTISFDLAGADLSELLNRVIALPQRAVTLLQNMLREQERMDNYSSDILIAQLTILLALIRRENLAPSAGKLQGANVVHNENEIIRQAQQYISEHIREKLSVPLVAHQVDVSASYLTVLFRKNLQISPGEYIRRVKLQESKQMIREKNMNFTQIAMALQYSTVHHFSRQFKEKFGITPSEYAKSVR